MFAVLRIHSPLAAVALVVLAACSSGAPIDRRSDQAPIGDGRSAPSLAHGASTAWAQSAYAKLPLTFEANVGQTDAQVDFLARGAGYSLFLTQGDAVLALRAHELSAGRNPAGFTAALATTAARPASIGVLRMHVLDGNPLTRATPERRLSEVVNYFIGNDPATWRVGVPTYARITYPDIYPGIDLDYYGNQGHLEYDFVVRPGADPSAIALRYQGAQALELDARGDLILRIAGQQVRQTKPIIFQDIDGERREVVGAYQLRDGSTVGFELADYDRTRPLVIDPTLVYSTYLGGSGSDHAQGIAVDGSGSAYVVGITASTNFPTTTGALSTTLSGGQDAFVTKLNPAGTARVYSTYLGGGGSDQGLGITVDSSLSAYVTGSTSSENYPTTPGAFQPDYAGGSDDAFVTKLNPTGGALLYSTYLGGGAREHGFGIALDSSLNAYVAGLTSSEDFPTTPGASDTTLTHTDAFVTKLNSTGTMLAYSTYLGGSGTDGAFAIAVDSAGSAYVTGQTQGGAGFPLTTGAFQTTYGGFVSDAFVSKLNPTGSALLYSTYLGGNLDDGGEGIAVDSMLNAYVTGFTGSSNFPTTPGAFAPTQPTHPPGHLNLDAFVTKLNSTGSALVYSTYLGGTEGTEGFAIALDSLRNAYVTGETTSPNFPTTPGADTTLGGVGDAFVTKLNTTGSALVYSTFLGGESGFEQGFGIAVDSAGSAYVTGETNSTDFPTTAGAFDTTHNGGLEAFVTKISDIGPPATLTLDPLTAVNAVGEKHCVTATVRDALGNPTPGITVRFNVVGAQATFASPASGMDTTDAAGQAEFCFSAELPGDNVIHAFADTNGDGDEDAPGEPSGNANKTWTVPPSTELCEVKVTEGGQITALNGDRANFGGVATADAAGNVSGNENYQDHGPAQPLHMKSTRITAVTCSPDRTTATIFGDATIDGAGSFKFRIRVSDHDDSGIGDVYGIILSNGYASGDQTLEGGNVQIH